jgi:hypothetical protein
MEVRSGGTNAGCRLLIDDRRFSIDNGESTIDKSAWF